MADKLTDKLLQKREIVEENEETLSNRLCDESKKMWIIAAPAIFTRATTFGLGVISLAFMGHVGPTELAAYSIIQTVFIRFANGILLGMASGLETLCGQSFGAKQYHMLGIHLQRSWLLLTIAATLLVPVYVFASPILKLLGQEDHIADVAGIVALWAIPVLYSFVFSFTCQMFLQAQSKNMIIAYLAVVTLAIHIFLSWLLTIKYNFGIPGVMISTILAYWIPNIGQVYFIIGGRCSETWNGFSFYAFKDLVPILKLSISSGVMLCLELWYNTILLLLTGNLKNAEVAIDALAICININGWEMMISLGFLAAVSVRVANELGKGSSKDAIFSIWNCVVQSSIIGFVLFVFFMLFRGRLAYIFTDSQEVALAVDDLSTLLAFSILLNSVQPVLSGVAIGAGWQSIVAYVNIGCYYILGIPIGVVLGYVFNWGVKGVWMGMLIGTLIQTIVLCIITCKTNWEKQVASARLHLSKWIIDTENTPLA